MKRPLDGTRLVMGTDYYPEQWDPSLWDEDLRRMRETGIEVIRIAEFAWNIFSPREGVFTFDFFDDFLAHCQKAGMQVIFGTPTATPPAWLTQRYPEVLNARIDGALYRHGARRHYNYNSVIYQRFVRELVGKLAAHYGPHPSVIGWQIDNEINCEVSEFYSDSDTLAFRSFLKDRYGTIENLNKAWGTVFWNQTYSSWGEVEAPRLTPSGNHNPHEMLDYRRFVSDSACRWAKMQSEIIRPYLKPGNFITTNGIFPDVDYHRMVQESLDFLTYDSYPNMANALGYRPPKGSLGDRESSICLDEVRSIHGIFGIMEQQSGANGGTGSAASPSPRPGQITLWTMQSIAHGADFVSYFRWRTATMGAEIYWHGILDYAGRENRRIGVIRNIHGLLQKIGAVAGKPYEAKVGLVTTYDNQWDAEVDTWHGKIAQQSVSAICRAAQHTHTPMDFVYLREDTKAADLAKYAVLFYPAEKKKKKWQAEVLRQYVAQGGSLVFGCRAGLKGTNGQCTQKELPGVFRDLAGCEVREFTFVAEDEGTIHADWEGTRIETVLFNEELAPLGEAKVLARYQESYYCGVPALIENPVGEGRVYYFGSAFSEEAARVFLEKLSAADPYDSLLTAPACCEIAARADRRERYLFLLNYDKSAQEVIVHTPLRDLYTGRKIEESLTLPGYGTAVFLQEIPSAASKTE